MITHCKSIVVSEKLIYFSKLQKGWNWFQPEMPRRTSHVCPPTCCNSKGPDWQYDAVALKNNHMLVQLETQVDSNANVLHPQGQPPVGLALNPPPLGSLYGFGSAKLWIPAARDWQSASCQSYFSCFTDDCLMNKWVVQHGSALVRCTFCKQKSIKSPRVLCYFIPQEILSYYEADCLWFLPCRSALS